MQEYFKRSPKTKLNSVNMMKMRQLQKRLNSVNISCSQVLLAGAVSSSYESVVRPFYAYWENFSTARQFHSSDKWDLREVCAIVCHLSHPVGGWASDEARHGKRQQKAPRLAPQRVQHECAGMNHAMHCILLHCKYGVIAAISSLPLCLCLSACLLCVNLSVCVCVSARVSVCRSPIPNIQELASFVKKRDQRIAVHQVQFPYDIGTVFLQVVASF